MKENGGNSPAFPPRRTRPVGTPAVPAFFWSRVARARPLLQTWSGTYPNSWFHASLALAFYTAGVNRRCPLAGYIFNSGPECRQTPIHPLQRPDAVTSGCGVNVLRSLLKSLWYGLYMLCLLVNTPFSPAVQKIRETLVTSQLSPSWQLDDKEAESETPCSYSLV